MKETALIYLGIIAIIITIGMMFLVVEKQAHEHTMQVIEEVRKIPHGEYDNLEVSTLFFTVERR